MNFLRSCILFYIGGTAYMSLEFLWRRRSHGSMFLLGGLCFLLLGRTEKVKSLPRFLRPVVGAGIVTILELFTGFLVNKNHKIWDYRDQPLNYRGQICPVYSILWIPVSFVAMKLYAFTHKQIARKLR